MLQLFYTKEFKSQLRYRTSVILLLIFIGLLAAPTVTMAKTYSARKLLTTAVKVSDKLSWQTRTAFKKNVKLARALLVKGNVTLGNAATDLIKVNGTLSSALGSIEINDDVHITGRLDLDKPLDSADLPVSEIVTSLTEGANIDITNNGSGHYTIAANATDDTDITYTAGTGLTLDGMQFSSILGTSIDASELASSSCTINQILKYNGSAWVCADDADTDTTYTAGTGISLVGTAFSSSLGTSISATELETGAVDTAALNSSAIQAGDIEVGDLPSDGYAAVYVNTGGDTLTGTFAIDSATLTSNSVPRQLPGIQQIPTASTKTNIDSTGTVGQYSSTTIGIDGLPVISYYETTSGDLKVTKCGNAACSDANTTTSVDKPGDVGRYTSITIGTDGFPVISYYDVSNADLKVSKCSNSACSDTNTTTSVDSGGDVGKYTSITIGSDGFPVISYFDDTNDDLKVTKCGNASCSASNTTTSVDTAGAGFDSSIAIGTDGFPVISYYDLGNADLKVTKCGNAACSSSNTTTSVDTIALVGEYTSITIGTDGFPVISYYDQTNDDLKVTKCGNGTCSVSNTTTSVDTTSVVGEYTSITIGADGFPVIGYYDSTNSDLKILKCGNASCSTSNTITSVDSNGDVGQYTSITIGSDGNPVLSYYDVTNQDLKVYKASNPFHRDYWTRR